VLRVSAAAWAEPAMTKAARARDFRTSFMGPLQGWVE